MLHLCEFFFIPVFKEAQTCVLFNGCLLSLDSVKKHEILIIL